VNLSEGGFFEEIKYMVKKPPSIKQEPKEDVFVWTQELVEEFIMTENCGYSIELLRSQLRGFKQSKQPLPKEKSRWEKSEAFVAACTALDNVMKNANDDSDGKNGMWSMSHINKFQDELLKQGYSINSLKQQP
jgi:hypothetical protein